MCNCYRITLYHELIAVFSFFILLKKIFLILIDFETKSIFMNRMNNLQKLNSTTNIYAELNISTLGIQKYVSHPLESVVDLVVV